MNTATITPEARLANAHAKLDEWLGEYEDWSTEGKMDQYLSDLHWAIVHMETENHEGKAPGDLCSFEMCLHDVREAYERLNAEWEGRE